MGWRAQRIVRVLWEGESSSETAGDEIKTPSGDPLMSLGELPLLALMIWSGLWIYWANDVYRLGLGFLALFKFFPRLLPHLRCGSPTGQRHGGHFFFMWFFALNGVVYMAYTLLSGEWRHLVPSRQPFREAILVALHDLRLWEGKTPTTEIQRGTANRLHHHHRDGIRFPNYRTRHLQADAVCLACWAARGLQGGTLRALRAGLRLCALLCDSHRPGYPGRMEQFPCHGERLPTGFL